MDALLLVDDPPVDSDALLLEMHRLHSVGDALPLERLERNREHYQLLFERHQRAVQALQVILERYRLIIAHGRRMMGRGRREKEPSRQLENRPQLPGPHSP